MLGRFSDSFVFPAPQPTYNFNSYQRHLCWIPWNPVISPKRVAEATGKDGGIPCLWFPAPKAATAIVFFHGNAEDLGMCFAVLKHMRNQFKVNVLGVEFPGYGLLQGETPSEESVREVALTAFRYLVDKVSVSYAQMVLCGRSLGSGPAVYLAAQYPVGGLILVSAFTSVRNAVSSIAGPLVAWSFKDCFHNSRIIANVSCACLFIHGESDKLIPVEHTLKLFEKCRARKLLITPSDMEHNSNLFSDSAYLAVPAIHFFGFPGYYTTTPPRLPSALFKVPGGVAHQRLEELPKPWLCICEATERVPKESKYLDSLQERANPYGFESVPEPNRPRKNPQTKDDEGSGQSGSDDGSGYEPNVVEVDEGEGHDYEPLADTCRDYEPITDSSLNYEALPRVGAGIIAHDAVHTVAGVDEDIPEPVPMQNGGNGYDKYEFEVSDEGDDSLSEGEDGMPSSRRGGQGISRV